MAKSMMLVGTASNVGKSILCTALCRIFAQDGWRVAPFKAQNMSLNSAVTPSGREIGRAQAAQAEACGILPNEHMNPILLKPTGQMRTQIVLQGHVYATKSAREYFTDHKHELWQAVRESYNYLADRYELVVMEGAGSPVELNLKPRDIVNMRAAEMANAQVLLVADIDRGGVFASVVGTIALLDKEERARIKGIIINRFQGDPALFAEGVSMLQELTGVPVLGVIPFIRDIGIDEEDSVGLNATRYRMQGEENAEDPIGKLQIAILQLPHIANYTDFDPLFMEGALAPYFCADVRGLEHAAAVILPGTKSTMGDLKWLHETGLFQKLQELSRRGIPIFGICGGYQMLGEKVYDPEFFESNVDELKGLGLFPLSTTIHSRKRTVLVQGRTKGIFPGIFVEGYEIHMGITQYHGQVDPLHEMLQSDLSDEAQFEGAVAQNGQIIGTYMHGIFHNDAFRMQWINWLLDRNGLPQISQQMSVDEVRLQAYNRLADVVRANLDMEAIYTLLRI